MLLMFVFVLNCFVYVWRSKYLLYGPLAAKALYSWMYEDDILKDLWCIHILLICTLRGFIHQLWSSYNNMFFLTRNRWIKQQGVDFKQIDNEWDWYIYTYNIHEILFPIK